MTTPSPSSAPYKHTDCMPKHLRQELEAFGSTACLEDGILVEKQNVVRNYAGRTFTYTLLHTSELLNVRWYQCTSRRNTSRGVLVAVGPSMPQPQIIARSPSGAPKRFRVWQGPEKGFRGSAWEIVKNAVVTGGGGRFERGPLRSNVTESQAGSKLEDAIDVAEDDSDIDPKPGAGPKKEMTLAPPPSTPESSTTTTLVPCPSSDAAQAEEEASDDREQRPPKRIKLESNDSTTSHHLASPPADDTDAADNTTLQSQLGPLSKQILNLKVRYLSAPKNIIFRERSWKNCNSSDDLFMQAITANLLRSSSDKRPLKATIKFCANGDDDNGEEDRTVAEVRLMKGDPADFQALVDEIARVGLVKTEDEDGEGKGLEGMYIEVRVL
ncbi:uncharacterized protein AB675_8707 [Cyphellophora attinorum]|uniref:Uncharacterized protein n=1 Tax=Cyphellophora attinorum TaxID=1664694 RepID=A0A0N1H9G8_9EURO|nr:uncharacterized protein AB675_8707 [Phialophora attinorum]KPI44264.1 hypothetical protein AB675_8707 [Phialophora attinorum]